MTSQFPSPTVLRLQNGATALSLRSIGRRRAALTLYFPTGSRFETSETNGTSHFLEHMLFRGSPRYPSSERLAQAFEDLGGTLEASTSTSYGNLSISLPRENLLSVIEPLADVFQRPLLNQIEVERAIIREEILEDFDDAGQLIDGPSLVRALAFPGHGLGLPITGPPSVVESLSIEDLRAHHDRTYVASRLVIGLGGDFDEQALLTEVERCFGEVKAGEVPTFEAPGAQAEPRFTLVRSRGSSQTSVHVAYRTAGHFDAMDPALEMLLRILDDGMSTRLYQRLCDQSGLCYDASANYSAHEDAGLIEFEAETAHGSTDRVVREICEMAEQLASGLVSEAELERAQRRARWQYESITDHLHGLVDHLALAELEGTPAPGQHLEALLAVTRNDLLAAAQGVLAGSQRSTVVVGAPSARVAERVEQLALSR
jgi:predicted Zn-dependent peptidase